MYIIGAGFQNDTAMEILKQNCIAMLLLIHWPIELSVCNHYPLSPLPPTILSESR
jgi:hypothetical protein